MKNYDFSKECCSEVHSTEADKLKSQLMDENLLYEMSELFKVFGDSTRTRILSVLLHNELCVCAIAELLNMTKSAISHQLRILRQAKLVKNRKQGKEVFYSLADGHIESIFELALEHIQE